MSTKAKTAVARICAGREPPSNDDLAKTLAGEARRVALLVWWGTYTEDEAREELRALYRVHAVAAYPDMDEAAADAYDEAFALLGQYFAVAIDKLAWRAQQRLMDGGDMMAAAKDAVALAQDLRPVPAPYMVQDALTRASEAHSYECALAEQRRRRLLSA